MFRHRISFDHGVGGRKFQGVTLIELMITIAIAAILAAIAIPNFSDLIARNRLATYANDMLSSLQFARSEAIRTGASVSLCRSTSGVACTTSEWENGWIAFRDRNSNGNVDTGEEIVRIWQSRANGYTVRPEGFSGAVTYRGTGFSSVSGVFLICRNQNLDGARAVILARARPRLATDSDGDGIPEDDLNNAFTTCTPS